jgi:hypothetical protein
MSFDLNLYLMTKGFVKADAKGKEARRAGEDRLLLISPKKLIAVAPKDLTVQKRPASKPLTRRSYPRVAVQSVLQEEKLKLSILKLHDLRTEKKCLIARKQSQKASISPSPVLMQIKTTPSRNLLK